jgi:predicted GTPase
LIYDLENYGVILLGKTSYTLEQLEEAFTKAVGDEAAVLLMERLQKNMQNE